MRTVIITQGAYGYKPEGRSVRAVTRGQSVDLSDAEAARIVALGVAEYADAHEAEEKDAFFDPEELIKLTVADLKCLCEQMELDTAGCRKKADYIALICEESDGEDGGDEDPPELGAVDPV